MEDVKSFTDACVHIRTRSTEKKRKFTETVELVFGLKDLNLKDPSNRFNIETLLPFEIQKKINIAIIATGNVATQANSLGLTVISKKDLEDLGKDPKKAKKIANNHDFFLAEPEFMGLVGRFLGRVLGPRGKIHKPIPPAVAGDLEKFLSNYKRTVRMRIKANPTIGLKIGTLDNTDEELNENATSIYNVLTGKLTKGTSQIKNIYLKTTMGSPVKVSLKN